jgi:hypothetical protein
LETLKITCASGAEIEPWLISLGNSCQRLKRLQLHLSFQDNMKNDILQAFLDLEKTPRPL